MRDPHYSPTPFRNTIKNTPGQPTKAEARAEARSRRLERAEFAKRHAATPRSKFRNMSVADRIAFIRRKKKREEQE